MSDLDRPSERRGHTAALVSRARAGDREAIGHLFSASVERLLLFIRLRLGAELASQIEPMDVLQETWLEALRSLRLPQAFEHRGRGSFGAWLCRIAERVIGELLDRQRARKRRPPGAMKELSAALDSVRAPASGPRTAAARRERDERLLGAMQALEPDQRRALLLRYFEDLTVDEMARQLARSPTAVRRLLGRASARLGGLMSEAAPDRAS